MSGSNDDFAKSVERLAHILTPEFVGALERSLLNPHASDMEAFTARLASVPPEKPKSHQLDFGNGGLVIDGITAAKAWVSVGDSQATVWVDDWAIKDKTAFLSLIPGTSGGTCQLQYFGAYGAGADDQLVSWTSGTTGDKAWRATQVGSYISAKSIPTAPSITVTEFELQKAGVKVGHLFRRTFTQSGETWVEDHWVTRENYARPSANNPIHIVHVTNTANLLGRLQTLRDEANNPQGNPPPPAPQYYLFMKSRLHEYPKL